MMEVKLSRHCIEKALNEYGFKTEDAVAISVERAIKRGKKAIDHSSVEKKYLQRKSCSNKQAIVYNNYCYIIAENDFCITLHPLPIWFGKGKHFDGKVRIRNHKKYDKYHYMENEIRSMENVA